MAYTVLRDRRFLAIALFLVLFLPSVACFVDVMHVEPGSPYNISSGKEFGESVVRASSDVPPAPINVSIGFEGGGVVLSWSPPSYFNSSDIVGYKVYRRSSLYLGSSENWICIATINNITYTDYTVEESSGYYYSVSLLTPYAESPRSSWVHVSTPASFGSEPYPWWISIMAIAVGGFLVYGIYWATGQGKNSAERKQPIPFESAHTLKLMRKSRIGGILGLIMLLNSIPGFFIFTWIALADSPSYETGWILFILLPTTFIQAAAGFLLFRNGKHIRNDIQWGRLSRARSRVQVCIVWGAISIVSSIFSPILFAIITQSSLSMIMGLFSVLVPLAPTILFSIIYPDFTMEPNLVEERPSVKNALTRGPSVFESGQKERLWPAFGIVGSLFTIIGAIILLFFLLLLSSGGLITIYVYEGLFIFFVPTALIAVGLSFIGVGFYGYYLLIRRKLYLTMSVVGVVASIIYMWLVVTCVEIAYRYQNTAGYLYDGIIVRSEYTFNSNFSHSNLLIGLLLLFTAFIYLTLYAFMKQNGQKRLAILSVTLHISAGMIFIVSSGSAIGWLFVIPAEIASIVFFYRTPGDIEPIEGYPLYDKEDTPPLHSSEK